MLRKMLLVSPEYFESLRRHDDEHIYMEARNDRRHMRSLLMKKKNALPSDRWVKFREVQDPLLRRARKKRRPLTLPICETEATGPKYIDIGKQTYEPYRAVDNENDNGFVADYVMPGDKEIARFGETHFGRIATLYLSE